MEGNAMAGGMMPGMLGLDMQLHQPHQHGGHQTPTPPPPTLQQQQHLLMFASQSQVHHNLDADRNVAVAPKHVYTFGGGGTKVKPAQSSEDEPSTAFGEECSGGAGGIMELGVKHQQHQQQRGLAPSSSASPTAPSPWQRMKWTDTMVRLLIMVVYCVGDDGAGPDGGGAHHTTGKAGKKGASSAAAAPSAGLLQLQQQQQKKGKWKSVSRAMMEKGYYVSPQQCEDKFNDLNKRYKRVNDILGRGTACRVVENQALLDAMDHLSPKAREEVRKLLNSKHLFFREMCAYHRSCAVSTANAGAAAGGGEAASALQSHHLQSCEALAASDSSQLLLQQQPQRTPSGAVGNPQAASISARAEEGDAGLKMKVGQEEDGMAADDDDDEEDDEDDYEDEDDLDEDDLNEDEEAPAGRAGNEIGYHYHQRRRHLRRPGVHGDEEEEEDSKEGSLSLHAAGGYKRKRSASYSPFSRSPSQQQLRVEMAALTGTAEQQRQWLRWRAVELEQKRVNYAHRSLELERRRFKWLRFSGNKEREMERAKLENERLSLETDRMLLLLRHKELELSSQYRGGEAELLHNSSSSPVPNTAQSTSAA